MKFSTMMASAGLLGLLAATSGCSNGSLSVGDDVEVKEIGSIGLGLTLPNGYVVNEVSYTVSDGSGVVVRSGAILVGADGRASATLYGFAPGAGYIATLSTTPIDGGSAANGCFGQSAPFAVVANQEANVDVIMSCGELEPPEGTVSINGQLDVCPRIAGTTVSPTTVAVGSTAQLTASATDRDGDAITLTWTQTSGSVSPQSGGQTTYTCSAPGTHTVTLTATDAPGCARSKAISISCVGDGGTAGGTDAGVAQIQILGFNDFHGNVEEPTGSSATVVTGRGVDGGAAPTLTAGGAAYFAQHIATLRAQNPNTVVVSAGDLIGASPLVSALFHDEPTIEAMNLTGLDIGGVGNHEFDEGKNELLRMQFGGCHPIDGCQDGTPFAGASFKMLASNVLTDAPLSSTLFDRYTIKTMDGVKVAFIAMTLEGTPSIVTPSGVAGLTFLDEADTVNALIPELRNQGVRTVVVVIHEGGFQTGLYNECVGISGAINEIVERLDDEVDLVISGHTHAAYNCIIDGKRVTSALSFGRLITQVQMTVDRASQNVVELTAVNRVVTRDVTPVAEVAQLVSRYVGLAAPLRDRIIGQASSALTRAGTPSLTNSVTGESTLGDVIADAQRAATLDPSRPEPHIAFMNPGGVRADLDAGPITYGESFTIQPFGNSLVALTLTGAQIDTLLEQQFSASVTRILHPSFNVQYTFSLVAPSGSRVSNISIGGAPLDAAARYRVTVNNFLSTGGDGFLVLNEGTERIGGDVYVDALEKYLRANNPITPPAQTRITRLD